MKRIKFSEYYLLSNHFIVFDGYMSYKKDKKTEIIKDIGENFPKYSRCKNNETKTDTIRNLYCKMCNKLNMKYVTNDSLKELEVKINDIYHNVYFRIKRDYDEDIKWLDSFIDSNNTLFPIGILFKLFVLANKLLPQELLEKHTNTYKILSYYEEFFFGKIKDVYTVVKLIFEDNFQFEYSSSYDNELVHEVLATKFYNCKQYGCAITHADAAIERYTKNKNFIRIFMCDLIRLSCYNLSQSYREANNLAKIYNHSIESLNVNDFQKNLLRLHLTLSYLGLKDYKNALVILKQKEQLNHNDIMTYIVVKMNYKEEYDYTILEDKVKSNEIFKNIIDVCINQKYNKEKLVKFIKESKNISKVFLNLV